MRTFFYTAVLLAGVILAPLPAHAWPGTILAVPDGDTVVVSPAKGQKKSVKIRLYGIDAPELGQTSGPEARQWLASRLPRGTEVDVTTKDTDQYGRVVGVLRHGDSILNGDMVAEGFAWVYWPFCKDRVCHDWGKAQKKARAERLGLWKEKNPERPDRWRRKHPRK